MTLPYDYSRCNGRIVTQQLLATIVEVGKEDEK